MEPNLSLKHTIVIGGDDDDGGDGDGDDGDDDDDDCVWVFVLVLLFVFSYELTPAPRITNEMSMQSKPRLLSNNSSDNPTRSLPMKAPLPRRQLCKQIIECIV